jgi:hypothetical protein
MSIYGNILYYDNGTNTLNTNARFNQPAYKVVSTVAATQSITTATVTPIAFTTDTLTNWPVRALNTRFVAPVAGTYLIVASAGYATPPGTAGTNKMMVFLNTTLIAEQSFPYATAVAQFNLTCLAAMNGTTDYISVALYQASGGSVNAGGTNADGGNYNNVTITRIQS